MKCENFYSANIDCFCHLKLIAGRKAASTGLLSFVFIFIIAFNPFLNPKKLINLNLQRENGSYKNYLSAQKDEVQQQNSDKVHPTPLTSVLSIIPPSLSEISDSHIATNREHNPIQNSIPTTAITPTISESRETNEGKQDTRVKSLQTALPCSASFMVLVL